MTTLTEEIAATISASERRAALIVALELPPILELLEHRGQPLVLYSFFEDGLHQAEDSEPPSAIQRVESRGDGDQYVYADREGPSWPWSRVLWGEYTEAVEADTPLEGATIKEQIAALRYGMGATRTVPEHLIREVVLEPLPPSDFEVMQDELLAKLKAQRAEVERLRDLVRHQRGALHDEGLITDEEYAALVAVDGSPARLEGYDEMRVEIAGGRLMLLTLQLCEAIHKHGNESDEAEAIRDLTDGPHYAASAEYHAAAGRIAAAFNAIGDPGLVVIWGKTFHEQDAEIKAQRDEIARLEHDLAWERDVVVRDLEIKVAHLESPTGAREVLANVARFKSSGYGWQVVEEDGGPIGFAQPTRTAPQYWEWAVTPGPRSRHETRVECLRKLCSELTDAGYRVDYDALPVELRAGVTE